MAIKFGGEAFLRGQVQIPSMNLTSSTSNDAILTKAEAAEFLRIKPRTVDEWMRRGRIPFCKLPSGTVRFRRDQLIEFLGKFEVGA
jgi:excisionase family DNA binding protein